MRTGLTYGDDELPFTVEMTEMVAAGRTRTAHRWSVRCTESALRVLIDAVNAAAKPGRLLWGRYWVNWEKLGPTHGESMPE